MSQGRFASLAAALALCACAVTPPTGPNVLALPQAGKPLAQFQQEDGICRGYAQQQINAGAAGDLQQRYDAAYAQCMVASGNGVQFDPFAWPDGPSGYAAYPYGDLGSPWLVGPAVSLGFFGRFGPRFHNDFHHDGFRHDGFHHQGFHNQGFHNQGFHNQGSGHSDFHGR